MSRLIIALGLAFVCCSVYGQRGEHGPPTSGPSTTSGQSQTHSSSSLSQHGLTTRSSGTGRSGERSPLDGASATGQDHGSTLFSHRGESIRSNSSRGSDRSLTRHDSRPESSQGADHSAEQARRLNNALEKLTGHERALQVQLANADRMRDRAIETGDAAMLARADEYEQKARARFAELAGTPQSTEPGDSAVDSSELPESSLSRDGNRVRRPDDLRVHTPDNASAHTTDDLPDHAQDDLGSHTQNNSTEDEHGHRAFGQAISEAAKEDGKGFGQFTSEQARSLGRDFGRSNADQTRALPPPTTVVPDPNATPPSEPTTIPPSGPTSDVPSGT